MRTKLLLMFMTATVAGGLVASQVDFSEKQRSYTPQNVVGQMYSSYDYWQYMHQLKANQETKTIDAKFVRQAEEELRALAAKGGVDESFNWQEKGPNNIGGRTRALVVDKNDSHVIWAGSVSGGLWRSQTMGQYWEEIPYSIANGYTPKSISAMVQAADGKIYFGTGEPFASIDPAAAFVADNSAEAMIQGAGIFKQGSGDTFERLASTAPANTQDFIGVRRLAAHPTNANNLLAATTTGVFETTDGGQTWTKVIAEEGQSWDVVYSLNGNALANVGEKTYARPAGAASFTVVSGNELPEVTGRYVYTFAIEEPDICFASMTEEDGSLHGIFRSKDRGATWAQIGTGGSATFNVFGTTNQGISSHSMVAVDRRTMWIGGEDLWAGYGVADEDVFNWIIESGSTTTTHTDAYIHSGINSISLLNDDLIMATDGGIYRSVNQAAFRAINTYYNVTQIYRADINSRGQIVAAAQDNGILLMKYENAGSQQQAATTILQGSGTEAIFSRMSPDVFFFEICKGSMQRTNDFGVNFQTFWSDYMAQSTHSWSTETLTWGANDAAWIAPVAVWECDDYRGLRRDTSRVLLFSPLDSGVNYRLESANMAGQYVYVTADADYAVGDSISFADKYHSTIVFGLNNTIYFTRKAMNFKETVGRFDWWDIFYKRSWDGISTTVKDAKFVALEFSTGNTPSFDIDGDIVYAATAPTSEDTVEIIRIKNLHACRVDKHASFRAKNNNLNPGVERITEIQHLGKVKGRYVTDIAVDPKNPEALIVTMGQYGNENYIYYAANAATTTSMDFATNFVSIQGDLPHAPVYTACVNADPAVGNQLLVGTEYGVFVTDNYKAGAVEWKEANTGIGHFPVMDIKQYRYNVRRTADVTMGTFVVATHGRGVFTIDDKQFNVVSVGQEPEGIAAVSSFDVNVYPNPVVDQATVKITVDDRASVTVNVYNMNGARVYTTNTGRLEAGTHTIDIPMGDMTPGSYLVQCVNGASIQTTKILKY